MINLTEALIYAISALTGVFVVLLPLLAFHWMDSMKARSAAGPAAPKVVLVDTKKDNETAARLFPRIPEEVLRREHAHFAHLMPNYGEWLHFMHQQRNA